MCKIDEGAKRIKQVNLWYRLWARLHEVPYLSTVLISGWRRISGFVWICPVVWGSAGEELGHALLSRNSSLQCPWCGVVVGRSSWCSFNELCDWRLFVDDWNDVCSSGTVVCWRSIACVGRVGESCCCSRSMRGFFEELSDIGLRGAVF